MTEPSHALISESRDVLSTHARSFRWAGALLSRHHLDRAAVIYALCRLIDDLADEAPDPDTARIDLETVRAEVRALEAPRPVVRASCQVLDSAGVGIRPVTELLDGVTTDLDPVALPDDAALHRYAYQVAGTVGLMMCAVLEVSEPRALPFAVDLGVGMQITNICRDVFEDAHRGRVYLPATRLRAVGLSPERLVEAASGPPLTAQERKALSTVVCDLLDEADEYYTSADLGMRWIPWRSRLAIRIASRVYRAIGVRLRRRGGDAWAGRTRVGWLGKAGWSVAALWQAAWRRPRVPQHRPRLHRHLRDLPGCEA